MFLSWLTGVFAIQGIFMRVLVIGVMFLLLVSEVQAQSSRQPVKMYFRDLSETSKLSCENLKDLREKYKEQNRLAAVESIQATIHNMCSCMPAQIKKTSSKLSANQLKTVVTKRQFMQKYQPIIDTCAAAQLRFPYGKKCNQRFKEVKTNSGRYCKCMRKYLKNLSNRQATQIGKEASEYEQASRIYRENNLPLPPRPSLYDSFLKKDESCSAR